MARFFLDENLSMSVVSLLRAMGHDVTTARDEHLIHAHDDEQLSFAAGHGAILVSHDGDFYVLHRGIRRWLQQRGETAMLPAANERYEWFPDREWVRCP